VCFNPRWPHALLVSLVVLFIQDCAYRKTIFINDVFTNPKIDYGQYNKIAVLVFEQDIEIKERGLHKTFTELTQKELIEEGYDIVMSDALDVLLNRLKLSRQDSVKIENAQRIKKEMNVSAIIKGDIDSYNIGRELKHGTVRSVGRQLDPNPMHDKADTRIYVANISLRMEMIELQEADTIWSCSISFKDYKTDENGEELVKKIIKRCLDTLPKTWAENIVEELRQIKRLAEAGIE